MESLERGIHTLLATWLIALVAVTLHVGSAWIPASAFCGSWMVFLLWQPSRREILFSVLLGIVAGWAYRLHGGSWNGSPGAVIAAYGAFFGMGSLATLILQWRWAPGNDRRFLEQKLRCAGLMPAMCAIAGILLGTAAILNPFTYDRLLLLCDLRLGITPTWSLARALHSYPWLDLPCEFVYYSLPATTAVCFFIEQRFPHGGVENCTKLQRVAVALALGGSYFFNCALPLARTWLSALSFRALFPTP